MTEVTDNRLRVRVQLPHYVVRELRAHGDIGRVVNRILAACADNGLEFEEMAEEPVSVIPDMMRIFVVVDEPRYLEALARMGEHSNRISLSRVIMYVFDNELIQEYNMQLDDPQYLSDIAHKRDKHVATITKELHRLYDCTTQDNYALYKQLNKVITEWVKYNKMYKGE